MEVMPLTVGRTARAWDDQHLDVAAAAEQIAGAPTGGFTSAVSGAAARFAIQWERHTGELAADAEARADGLRAAIADYLTTDDAVSAGVLGLQSYLTEVR